MYRLLLTWAAVSLFGGGAAIAAAADMREWSSFEEADRIYHEAILEGTAIEDWVALLKADASGSALERGQRLHLASLLQWRHGDREAALSSVDEALDIERHGVLLHQRGRLLEALSRIDEAIESYREALPLLSGSSRTDTELRMALLIASERGEIEPLLTLAEGGNAAVRNRVAMVLAVLGHAGEAASLYSLPAGASVDGQWRYALRLTEWGLWAGDPGKARDAAWQAVDLADGEQDRLYALALLTEAYRQANALPALVEALGSGRDVGGASRALWVSLLREIGRPAEALAALDGSAEHEPPAVKRQFVGIYRESGRTAEMVAELERLMVADPDETIWPQGLAEFYLERGDRSSAESTWRAFVERAGAAEALLDGAAVMQKLGFDELALAAAAKAQQQTVANRAGRDAALDRAARFRFELCLARGRRDEARGVLESLEAATEASDPMRQNIAMAYERLNLPAEALRVARSLVGSQVGRDTAIREYLADLLLRNGEAQQAVDLLMGTLPDASTSQLRLLHTRLIAAARAAGIEDDLAADLTARVNDGVATEHEARLLIEMQIRADNEAEALALIDTLYGKAGADPLERLRQIAALRRVATERMPIGRETFQSNLDQALTRAQAYDRALVELAEQDAANAVFHVRSRIIHYIENLRFAAESDQEVSDTLIALLEQYLDVSEMGADREFVAGVLSLGGQRQAAIGIYREILAVDPSRLDSYLEIGSQLEALEQAPRAVGMYQYLLESSDREEISWVALDGILNLQSDRATLEWARRMALVRLSAAPQQFEYYRQLADLSADLGDGDRQLAALYNGLAAGAELRLPTLRELLRSTDGVEPGPATVSQGTTLAISGQGSGLAIVNQAGGVAADEDAGLAESVNRRHVAFGHRLLALNLAVPPDVYLSLGRAMIESGDTDAALRAVNRAVEQTGSDALVVQAAGIFRQAGDDLSALYLFEQALRNDPDNLDVLVDTAWSNERMGRKERAGQLFLEGLTTLLTQQPLRSEALFAVAGLAQPAASLDDSDLDRLLLDEGRELFPLVSSQGRTQDIEYQRYYVPLRNGLVRTLSGDAKMQTAVSNRVRDDYAATLALVRARQSVEAGPDQFPPRPSALPRLANYPRLRSQAQLRRYLAYTFGDHAAIDEMDEALLTLFPEDRQLPEILLSHRAEWSSSAYRDWLESGVIAPAAQKHAGPERLAVRTAAGDFLPGGEAALQAALDVAVQAGDAAETVRLVERLAETGLIWEALDRVEPHLSAADRKVVADRVIADLRNDPRRALDSLRIHVSHDMLQDLKHRPRPWAARLEDWSGEAVFDEAELLALVTSSADQQAGFSQLGSPDVWFTYHALSEANRDEWIKTLLEPTGTASSWSTGVFTLIALLLQAEPVDAGAEWVKALLRDYRADFSPLVLTLYRTDIHPDNVALARELVAIARERFATEFAELSALFPGPLYEPNFLRCAGKTDEALSKLADIVVEHYFESANLVGAVAFFQLSPKLVYGNEQKLIDLFEHRDLLSPEATKRRNLLLVQLRLLELSHHPLADADLTPLLGTVTDALQTDPTNYWLMELASSIYALTGDRANAQAFVRMQLEHLHTEGHEASLYAARLDALTQTSVELDHPIDAIAYRSALRQSAFGHRYTAAIGHQANSVPEVIVRALRGEDHVRLEREMGRFWQTVDISEQSAQQKPGFASSTNLPGIAAMLIGREQVAAAVLREHGYERLSDVKSLLPSLRDITGVAHPRGEIFTALARSQAHGGEPPLTPMLSALAEHPLGVEILEGWVTTVRGRMLGHARALIDALAMAHFHEGSARARFAELSAAIRDGQADDKELGLWLAIGSLVPELAAGEEADAVLADPAVLETAHRPSILLGMAKFLAVRGDQDGALRHYEALFHWAHGHGLSLPVFTTNHFSVSAVLATASETLDAGTFERFFRVVLESVKPRDDHLLPAYSEFVLNQIDAAGDPQRLYRAFGSDVDAALEVLGRESESVFRLLQVSLMQHRLNSDPAALDTLRRAMELEKAADVRESLESVLLVSRQFDRSAGEVVDPRRQQREEGDVERYRRMLGLDMPEFSWANREDIRIILTHAKSDGDLPGLLFSNSDIDWLRQADARIREWVSNGEVASDIGIDMLLGLLRICDERGFDNEAGSVFAFLKPQLLNDQVSFRTAAAIAVAAEDLGQPLNDARFDKRLLHKGAIEPERMAAAVRRIAAVEGAAAALEVGSKLLEFTLNDDLMDELIALADGNARPDQAEEWRLLQREARLARAELDRTEALTQVF